jgi:hypothetical protein
MSREFKDRVSTRPKRYVAVIVTSRPGRVALDRVEHAAVHPGFDPDRLEPVPPAVIRRDVGANTNPR